MKRSAAPFVMGLAVWVIFVAATNDVQTSGAPIGSTGAPNEHTCAKSGCHYEPNNLNTGKAILTIETQNKDFSTFNSGDTVKMVVSIQEDSIFRFGYSLTIIDEKGNSCGDFLVTDPRRTQMMHGYDRYANRQYMTYTRIGTNPYADGKGLWEFSWVMPNPRPRFVDVYLAAVAGNNDGTDKGDKVYTLHQRWQFNPSQVHPQPLKITQELNELVFYAQERINDARIHAFDNFGNKKTSLELPNGPESETRLDISTWPNGQYHLVIENNQNLSATKIVIAR